MSRKFTGDNGTELTKIKATLPVLNANQEQIAKLVSTVLTYNQICESSDPKDLKSALTMTRTAAMSDSPVNVTTDSNTTVTTVTTVKNDSNGSATHSEPSSQESQNYDVVQVQYQNARQDFRIPSRYIFQKCVGLGSSAMVGRFQIESTNAVVIIKKVSDALGEFADHSDEMLWKLSVMNEEATPIRAANTSRNMLRQLKAFRHLSHPLAHPNIAQVIDIIEPQSNAPTMFKELYIVMENMDTDLARLLTAEYEYHKEDLERLKAEKADYYGCCGCCGEIKR